ncbi:hypothetical protein HYPSUDRAFT_665148 [Hypholoma sublateritium FD-334 SS-4]|uniref:Uncharacterized protein n=1 Tax=Hypholoma sublateritium (strain FD-334 SS-4) TaxID=945553 RepID=A0A0D2MEU3_HYPSF|nr:hypothetical protein HYPSUDRAFT_665148 [Hypholoma sublateritium FD-334 SS-4]
MGSSFFSEEEGCEGNKKSLPSFTDALKLFPGHHLSDNQYCPRFISTRTQPPWFTLYPTDIMTLASICLARSRMQMANASTPLATPSALLITHPLQICCGALHWLAVPDLFRLGRVLPCHDLWKQTYIKTLLAYLDQESGMSLLSAAAVCPEPCMSRYQPATHPVGAYFLDSIHPRHYSI